MTIHTDLDGDAVIDQYWPVDGPHSARGLAEAAAALGELVRYANHATLDARARVLPTPQDSAVVVRRLGEALGRLPQLCEQIAGRAEQFAADADLRAADSADVPASAQALAAAELLSRLSAATDELRELAGQAASSLDALWLEPDDEAHR